MSDFFKQQNSYYSDYYTDDSERAGAKTYNLMIAGCLFWGFGINFVICRVFADYFYNMNPIILTVGYLILAFSGSAVVHRAQSTVGVFLGYNMIALPVGAVLSAYVVYYSPMLVSYAFLATTLVTVIIAAASYFYPDAFLSIGRVLATSLIAVILIEIVLTLVFRNSLQIIDYIVAVIFSLYIGYDMARAQRIEHTPENAVRVAAELYLDIINLFIRILSIMGRRSRD